MQFYDITVAVNAMQEVGVSGRYVYYVEGTTPNITAAVPGSDGNEAISIQAAGSGLNVILKPGQSIRLADDSPKPNAWRVTNAKKLEVITGKIVIGDGEFRDANIKNTVKLDLSSANQVTVQNASLATTVTNEVEVKNDAGNPLNVALSGTPAVSISGTANVQENLIAITNSFSSSQQFGNNAVQLVAPASNVNGIIIQSARLYGNGTNSYSLIAKASAPAGDFDGVVLAHVPATTTAAQFVELVNRLKVPAGLGLYWFVQTVTAAPVRLLNTTVL